MAPPFSPRLYPPVPVYPSLKAPLPLYPPASVKASSLSYWLCSCLLAVPCLPLALASPGLQCSETLSKLCILCFYTFHGSQNPQCTSSLAAAPPFGHALLLPSFHPCSVIPNDLMSSENCTACSLAWVSHSSYSLHLPNLMALASHGRPLLRLQDLALVSTPLGNPFCLFPMPFEGLRHNSSSWPLWHGLCLSQNKNCKNLFLHLLALAPELSGGRTMHFPSPCPCHQA